MKRVLAICVLVAAGCSEDDLSPVSSCYQTECWDEQFQVCRDDKMIELFTRQTGWTGGDATYSVELDQDRRIWLFGDTFIDQVNPDRTRSDFQIINNSLMLQVGDELTTIHGGTAESPVAFARPPETGHWYWPGDGTVFQNELLVFMHGFANEGGGAWDFYRTSIDLLTIDAENFTILSADRIAVNPTISWGAALMEDEDYTYVYGVKSDGLSKTLFVSRTDAGLRASWEYFSDDAWVPDEASATPVLEGVSEQFSVFKSDNEYYLLTQHNLFGNEIYLYHSDAPEGMFTDKQIVYCTPETGGDIYTYNAFVHTGFYQDSLLVSYNVNSFNIQDLMDDADNYRPYFIKVGNWQKQN